MMCLPMLPKSSWQSSYCDDCNDDYDDADFKSSWHSSYCDDCNDDDYDDDDFKSNSAVPIPLRDSCC